MAVTMAPFEETAARGLEVIAVDGECVLVGPWPAYAAWSLEMLFGLRQPPPPSGPATLVWQRAAGLLVLRVGRRCAVYEVIEDMPGEGALLSRLVKCWRDEPGSGEVA